MLNAKIAVGTALCGAFILGALAIGLSSASPNNENGSFSEIQEEEIGEIVRAYLMENPEVIIEAVNAYTERERIAALEQSRNAALSNLDRLLDPETAYISGKDKPNAKVAVIELFDYHCGFCKRAVGLVRDMTEGDEAVKVVFRELPILRQESELAAEMALAAREQGKFLDLHFAMMEAPGVLTRERIKTIAEAHGVDFARLETDAQKPNIDAAITANRVLAQELGIDGTPAFIIASLNGEYLEIVNGFREEYVRAKIEEAKQAAG